MELEEQPTPLERYIRRRKLVRFGIIISLVLLVGAWLLSKFHPNRPVDYSNIEDHFKYGSIGSDNLANGFPYWVWRVLPAVFPERLPGGYNAVGFVTEKHPHTGDYQDTPIGFSKRRRVIELLGMNCALCHTGTVRETAGSEPKIYLGMPANTIDLQRYHEFITSAAHDPRFTVNNIMLAIKEQGADLNIIESIIYRYIVIPRTREGIITRGGLLSFLNDPDHPRPRLGPGRVDTFNPYKTLVFGYPLSAMHTESVGAADPPSIWNQQARENLPSHWDGNNTSVEERNKSAATGAGVTPETIDLKRLKRIEHWLWSLSPPPYPFKVDQALASAGKVIYQGQCAACHDPKGAHMGQIVPIELIRTDRGRLDSFTPAVASNMNTVGAGFEWRFKHFRKTHGYVNSFLDGIWLRAPYLHNGSVPTIADLLKPPALRPKLFYRGNDVYDQGKVGFLATQASEGTRQFFPYDTTLEGNRNTGHDYGTDLQESDKSALLEYLKTL
jgi:hypothetical protein